MVREIERDLVELKKFTNNYRMPDWDVNSNFQKTISQFHKKYIGFLTLCAEIKSDTTSVHSAFSTLQSLYLSETCSDCGLAFFDLLHGNYKSSKLLLRSSIENFLKGISFTDIIDIHKEKSVYQIFDKVKAIPFFSSPISLAQYDIIHNKYKLLCEDVHTAHQTNMAQLSALNIFPSFNKTAAQKTVTIATDLLSSYCALILLKYNKFYHESIHFKNKPIIIQAVRRSIKPYINGMK